MTTFEKFLTWWVATTQALLFFFFAYGGVIGKLPIDMAIFFGLSCAFVVALCAHLIVGNYIIIKTRKGRGL